MKNNKKIKKTIVEVPLVSKIINNEKISPMLRKILVIIGIILVTVGLTVVVISSSSTLKNKLSLKSETSRTFLVFITDIIDFGSGNVTMRLNDQSIGELKKIYSTNIKSSTVDFGNGVNILVDVVSLSPKETLVLVNADNFNKIKKIHPTKFKEFQSVNFAFESKK